MTKSDDFLMGDGPAAAPDEDDTPPWVEARYDGICSTCGGSIIAGVTMIRADGWNEWECCGP